MAPAYISGTEACLPQAAITFDRYPGRALVHQAIDEVRRQEAREVAGLKAPRYRWLRNPETLTAGPRTAPRSLKGLDRKTALKRAYGFKTFENYRTIIYLIAGKLERPTRC